MRTALRAKILDSLAKVEGDNLVAISIKEFVHNAHLKTDEDIRRTVLALQSQIIGEGGLIKKLLADQFAFISTIEFEDAINSNVEVGFPMGYLV
jgi:hypothetical protein